MKREVTIKDFNIAGAERIGLPTGDNNGGCVDAFQTVTGIEVPAFRDRELWARSQGRDFFLLKAKDVPGCTAAGLLDLGVAGEDVVELDPFFDTPMLEDLQYLTIGEPICCLELMAEAGKKDRLEEYLWSNRAQSPVIMPVATPLPKVVNCHAGYLGLPMEAVSLPPGVTISGSMEVMPKLLERLGVELVADRVQTGETAKINGLAQIMQMWDIRPMLLQRINDENL